MEAGEGEGWTGFFITKALILAQPFKPQTATKISSANVTNRRMDFMKNEGNAEQTRALAPPANLPVHDVGKTAQRMVPEPSMSSASRLEKSNHVRSEQAEAAERVVHVAQMGFH